MGLMNLPNGEIAQNAWNAKYENDPRQLQADALKGTGAFYGMKRSMFSFAKGGLVNAPNGPGLIQGPGTGTSDSIDKAVPDGSFIIPANVVKEYGAKFFLDLIARLDTGQGTDKKVSAKVSNGEIEIPPAVVEALGVDFFATLIGAEDAEEDQAEREVGPDESYGMPEEDGPDEEMPMKGGLLAKTKNGKFYAAEGGLIDDLKRKAQNGLGAVQNYASDVYKKPVIPAIGKVAGDLGGLAKAAGTNVSNTVGALNDAYRATLYGRGNPTLAEQALEKLQPAEPQAPMASKDDQTFARLQSMAEKNPVPLIVDRPQQSMLGVKQPAPNNTIPNYDPPQAKQEEQPQQPRQPGLLGQVNVVPNNTQSNYGDYIEKARGLVQQGVNAQAGLKPSDKINVIPWVNREGQINELAGDLYTNAQKQENTAINQRLNQAEINSDNAYKQAQLGMERERQSGGLSNYYGRNGQQAGPQEKPAFNQEDISNAVELAGEGVTNSDIARLQNFSKRDSDAFKRLMGLAQTPEQQQQLIDKFSQQYGGLSPSLLKLVHGYN